MNEQLYHFYLESGQTVVLLSNPDCIKHNMLTMSNFVIQINAILKYDYDDILLRDKDLTEGKQTLLRLSFSSMPGDIEYSFVDLSTIDLQKYNYNGKICISDQIHDAYYVSNYNDKKYCLFLINR